MKEKFYFFFQMLRASTVFIIPENGKLFHLSNFIINDKQNHKIIRKFLRRFSVFLGVHKNLMKTFYIQKKIDVLSQQRCKWKWVWTSIFPVGKGRFYVMVCIYDKNGSFFSLLSFFFLTTDYESISRTNWKEQ